MGWIRNGEGRRYRMEEEEGEGDLLEGRRKREEVRREDRRRR